MAFAKFAPRSASTNGFSLTGTLASASSLLSPFIYLYNSLAASKPPKIPEKGWTERSWLFLARAMVLLTTDYSLKRESPKVGLKSLSFTTLSEKGDFKSSGFIWSSCLFSIF
tara:strand:- start:267 stop:602 length:336 start_codon:yes stop_codon:yes gene_type:complete